MRTRTARARTGAQPTPHSASWKTKAVYRLRRTVPAAAAASTDKIGGVLDRGGRMRMKPGGRRSKSRPAIRLGIVALDFGERRARRRILALAAEIHDEPTIQGDGAAAAFGRHRREALPFVRSGIIDVGIGRVVD